MNWPLRGALSLLCLLLCVGALAGCISLDPPPLVCSPPCGAGATCTARGCVGGLPDLSVFTPPDMAGCHPACGGTTPFCQGNRCVGCARHADCAPGMVCAVGLPLPICVPGCVDDKRCEGLGMTLPRCCHQRCVDLANNPSHCGGCGQPCGGGPGDGKVCTMGTCTATMCAAGTGDCNGDPGDGCESALLKDVRHCGDCATSCAFAHAVAVCNGSCFPDRCDPGFDDCNGTSSDGCETDLGADPANCGNCRNACPRVTHSTVRCVQGACAPLSCDRGFANCDGLGGNGCETATGTDPRNCGGCGKACGAAQVCVGGGCSCQQCAIPHARAKCPGNQCTFDSCADGWGDCNGNVADGCETSLAVDPSRCGGCGVVCPKNLPACLDGVCVAVNNRVLIVHCSRLDTDVKRVLESTGAFAAVDEFDATGGTPTLAQLRPYGALLVYSDLPFSDPVLLGDVLADYFDAGGSVVLASFASTAPAIAVKGRFGEVANGYLLLDAGGQEQPPDSLGRVLEPQSPLMAGVTRLVAQSAYRSKGPPRPGAVTVAEWSGGRPMVLRGAVKGRAVVSLNLHPPSVTARADLISGDLGALLRNALLYR